MPNPPKLPPNQMIPGAVTRLAWDQEQRDDNEGLRRRLDAAMQRPAQGVDPRLFQNVYNANQLTATEAMMRQQMMNRAAYDPFPGVEIAVHKDIARDGFQAVLRDKETGQAFSASYTSIDVENILGRIGIRSAYFARDRDNEQVFNTLKTVLYKKYQKYKESRRDNEVQRMVKLWEHQKDHWLPTKRLDQHSCFDWLPGEDPPTDEKPLRRVTFSVATVVVSASNAVYSITCDVPEARGTTIAFVTGPKPEETPYVIGRGEVRGFDFVESP